MGRECLQCASLVRVRERPDMTSAGEISSSTPHSLSPARVSSGTRRRYPTPVSVWMNTEAAQDPPRASAEAGGHRPEGIANRWRFPRPRAAGTGGSAPCRRAERAREEARIPWARVAPRPAHLHDATDEIDAQIADAKHGTFALALELMAQAARIRASSSFMPNGFVT